MSNKKVLLLALICGLITAVAVNFYLKSVREAASNVKTKKVAFANARIPSRTLITPEMISFKDIPVNVAHGSAAADPSQVVGYMTRAEIEAGEQILQTKLVPRESTGATLAYTVPLGMRAISVSVNEQTAVAGLLNPGDRVDVLGTVEVEIPSRDPNVNTIKLTKTHLILQNVEVLAVGQNYSAPGGQQGDGKDQKKSVPATVTLAVKADQVQLLVAIIDNNKGKLTLALRAPADKSEEDRPPMDAQELLR